MGMLRRAVPDQTREAQRESARQRTTDYEGCLVGRGWCVRKTEVESVAPPRCAGGGGAGDDNSIGHAEADDAMQ